MGLVDGMIGGRGEAQEGLGWISGEREAQVVVAIEWGSSRGTRDDRPEFRAYPDVILICWHKMRPMAPK